MGRSLKLFRFSPMKIILLGYCVIILLGSLLLTLPVAARSGESTSFSDAVFTATSATCVTGLIRFDTYTYWSLFGQLIILALIQIGGMGFMTIAVSLVSFTKKKIGLSQRSILQESVASPQIGGVVRMTKFILYGTLLVEGTGALLFSFSFIPVFGFWKGIYFSVFHSVSAFCNAGFDLMGGFIPFSSLISFQDHVYINCVTMALIVLGGLGFFVWSDLLQNKFRFRRLKLHSKLVLFVSVFLVLLGALTFLLLEQGGEAFQNKNAGQQILYSLFQSVTTRTAGFSTVDLASLREGTILLMICLMMVGGSTGSTAGGMKTTTLAVLFLSVTAYFRRKRSVECFGRRVDDDTFRVASCIMMLYMGLMLFSAILLSLAENVPILTALFETSSAVATVGLTLGLTPSVGIFSEIMLALLMLFGRVGSLTMLLAFSSNNGAASSSTLPLERVQLG